MAVRGKILIVEDEKNIANIIKFRLEEKDHTVDIALCADEALRLLSRKSFDIVLLDINLPGRSGLDVLQDVRNSSALLEIIMVTADTKIDDALKAIRGGAVDYVVKPIDFKVLFISIDKALGKIELKRQELAIQGLVESRAKFPNIVSESDAMKKIVVLLEKASACDLPVLILGETGTGKELIARTIHLKSSRSGSPYIPMNCSCFPDSLIESELFGHEKGAFTGADRTKYGYFEIANSGTIFMDEVADLSLQAQAKLLRVLESGEFMRVGGERVLKTYIRLVTATNKNLKEEVKEGRFRKDLYYRLNVVAITLPALRERVEDIRILAGYFMKILSQETGVKKVLSEKLLSSFEKYHWPGNVRELRNVVERILLLGEEDIEDLNQLHPGNADPEANPSYPLHLSLEELEKMHIERLLVSEKGNKRKVCRILKISEPTLYRKLKRYNI
ncbi:MAG: sigma-54-dependent Fis family transcriptional regulator [Planctomycetes bacterium]|nr:sigma-54-dependent Fis family transcriptional regulator [Planctomycetota bacterium]